MIFKDYIEDIENFFRERNITIDPLPQIKIDKSEVDLYNPFIKTGHYNPETKTIVLYVNKRHLKDILRSFCHELYHHFQNLEGPTFRDLNMSGTLKENKNLKLVEETAYIGGNILFREWTEERNHN